MSFKNNVIQCCIFSVLLTTAAMADPITLNISGNVIATPCTISNGGSQTVIMPDVAASSMVLSGNTGLAKNFDVVLNSCPTGTSSVTATFSGTADGTEPTKYANTATGGGAATNIAVQLQNRSGTVADKGNGSTMTVNVDASRKATFDLSAAPYSKGGTMPGSIQTVVLMNFTYN